MNKLIILASLLFSIANTAHAAVTMPVANYQNWPFQQWTMADVPWIGYKPYADRYNGFSLAVYCPEPAKTTRIYGFFRTVTPTSNAPDRKLKMWFQHGAGTYGTKSAIAVDHVSGDAGYSGYINNAYSKTRTNYVSIYRNQGTDIVDANVFITCQQIDGSFTTPFIANKVLY
jgi:hypothetical protein